MTVFTPVELAIPQFGMSRAVLMWCLPRCVELKIDETDPSVMRLHYDWASKVIRTLPEEARKPFLILLEGAHEAIAAAIPAERMRQFVRAPATRETLNRANNELHIIDRERERAGLPTFIQLIKHHLGIEAAPGTVAVVAKFTFVGSDPYEQA